MVHLSITLNALDWNTIKQEDVNVEWGHDSRNKFHLHRKAVFCFFIIICCRPTHSLITIISLTPKRSLSSQVIFNSPSLLILKTPCVCFSHRNWIHKWFSRLPFHRKRTELNNNMKKINPQGEWHGAKREYYRYSSHSFFPSSCLSRFLSVLYSYFVLFNPHTLNLIFIILILSPPTLSPRWITFAFFHSIPHAFLMWWSRCGNFFSKFIFIFNFI